MLTAEQIEEMRERDRNGWFILAKPDRAALLRDREEIVRRLRGVKYAETWSQLERLLDELLADLEVTK